MNIPEDQIQATLADATAAPVTVPTLEQISELAREDVEKLTADLMIAGQAAAARVKVLAIAEEQKIKDEAEAKWEAFIASPSFAALHLSVSSLALIGVGVLLVLRFL
jgi:hypothetical protein